MADLQITLKLIENGQEFMEELSQLDLSADQKAFRSLHQQIKDLRSAFAILENQVITGEVKLGLLDRPQK